ncbi:hypothetical protein DFQ26_001697 [Actinomortierella ambigua]|nr:hypothetical protein DFQ26_001697 [Actinomortierella ambigua]
MPLTNVFRQPFLSPFQDGKRVKRGLINIHDGHHINLPPDSHHPAQGAELSRHGNTYIYHEDSCEQYLSNPCTGSTKPQKGLIPQLSTKSRWRLTPSEMKRRLSSITRKASKENALPYSPRHVETPPSAAEGSTPISSGQSSSRPSPHQPSSRPLGILSTNSSSLHQRQKRKKLHARFAQNDTTSEIVSHNAELIRAQALPSVNSTPTEMTPRPHTDVLLTPVSSSAAAAALLLARSSSSNSLLLPLQSSSPSSSLTTPSEHSTKGDLQIDAQHKPHQQNRYPNSVTSEEACVPPRRVVVVTPSPPSCSSLTSSSNVSHTSGAGQQHSPGLLTIPSSSATDNDIYRSLQDELETTWDILLNSKLYYDERWDNASILSADSEVYRATVDPSLPHYPDRNDFWREHCRVRERKARQLQLQQIHLQTSERAQHPQQRDHQLYPEDALNEIAAVSAVQDPFPSSATIPLDNVNSIQLRCQEGREIALDARTLLEHQQSQLAHEFKPQLRRAMTPQSTRAPTFGSNGRARFKTYSAFISAMQEEQKKQCFLTLNETDQKDLSQARYFAAADSLAKTKLLDHMRALRERALSQQAARYAACRSRLADLFEGPITAEMPPQAAQLGVQVKKGPVPRTVDLEPSGNTHSMCPSRLSVNSTSIHHTLIKYQPSSFGQSDGEEDAEVQESAMPDALHHLNDTHAPKGPEQGILFMSTLPATVELSLSPPQFSLEAVKPSPKTDTQQLHAGPTAVADKFARGFPTSFFETDESDNTSNGSGSGSDTEVDSDCSVAASTFGECESPDAEMMVDIKGQETKDKKKKQVGNGFRMLQSSFGDQGFYRKLNAPHLSTCRVSRTNPLHVVERAS